MPAERENSNLEEILSALRNERSEIREQAIYNLFTYVNGIASEVTNDSPTELLAIEAFDMARTRLLHDRRIVETLLLTIKDSSSYVRTWTALLLDTSTTEESQKTLIRYLHSDLESWDASEKQKLTRQIVSRWKYVLQVSKKIVLLSGGCVSAILALCLCFTMLGLLGFCANFLGFMAIAILLFLIGCSIAMSRTAFIAAHRVTIGLPITRVNTADLPVEDSLVRPSQKPIEQQQAALLRAASENHTTPPEQLVRPAR